ncbi:MAG: biotin synthase, partial [Acidobacteria bacterium]|nr:biotin synthase [Acidobacteriota bacterium]
MAALTAAKLRYDWTVAEIEVLLTLPLPELIFRAQSVHRAHHPPDEIQGCALLSI